MKWAISYLSFQARMPTWPQQAVSGYFWCLVMETVRRRVREEYNSELLLLLLDDTDDCLTRAPRLWIVVTADYSKYRDKRRATLETAPQLPHTCAHTARL